MFCAVTLMRVGLFSNEVHYPADTGRKLDVHKTSRRRPGRLLKVLCTFYLRPVLRGRFFVLLVRIFQMNFFKRYRYFYKLNIQYF